METDSSLDPSEFDFEEARNPSISKEGIEFGDFGGFFILSRAEDEVVERHFEGICYGFDLLHFADLAISDP